jgi:hypothetical protein
VLNFDDLDEEKALWNVPRQKVVLRRDHREIVAALRPLITHAKKIRFVDPYFSADPDQLNIIAACLSFFPQIPNSRETNVELHVSGEQRAEETVEFIREKLRQILPNGLTPPSIVRWRHDYVHNRFVLTDRGGIQLGDSLRRHDERPDQLTLLEDHAWKFWWNRHDSGIHQSQLAP